MTEQKNRKSTLRIIAVVFALILIAGGIFAISLYQNFFAGNVTADKQYIYVRTGRSYNDFLRELSGSGVLKNYDRFLAAAKRMDLEDALKPGRYEVSTGMSNRAIINRIKSGSQTPVELKFQNFRQKGDFIAFLGRNLERDSTAFAHVLDSVPLLEANGFTLENSYTMYLPNSYEIYWNTTPMEFFNKMHGAFKNFWTDERLKKAAALKLTPQQVGVLASIVDAEALFDKEMPTIAGLYLNRLNRGIRLEADPTVIFANGDFTVKRVTGPLLRKDSKYNTYRNTGLPPGPIMMPSINALNAVLDHEKHNYIFMCAKEDFSGYHRFAETVAEHNINARKFRDELNRRQIFR